VMVGRFRTAPLKASHRSDDATVSRPFVALIAIPISYSITTGIVLGFIVHVLLKVLTGKIREVPVILWAVFVLSVVLLLI